MSGTTKSAVLYAFSGLPGTGKTTLARRLCAELSATYLRIDTIEQALRDLCSLRVEAEGYEIAFRLAIDNLRVGSSVVADSCNPIDLSRMAWVDVASRTGVSVVNIEIVCSDAAEHRRRVESRAGDIPGLALPTWRGVVAKDYEPWTCERIVIDTANGTIKDSFASLLLSLPNQRN